MKRLFSTMFLLVALLATASAQYFVIDTLRLNNAYKELIRSPIFSFDQRFIMDKDRKVHLHHIMHEFEH